VNGNHHENKKNIVVIGAGYAGLAFGALMAKNGHQVTLYEAHTYLGGCASFFKRKNFTFDAGATTLSGLGPKRPLAILNQHLGITCPVKKLIKPMELHLNDGRKILRSADLEEWLTTLEKEFPGHDHRTLWYTLKKREEDLCTILAQGQYFPPRSLTDFFKLLTPELIKRSPLGLWAFTPFIQTLSASMKKDQALMDLINEQLIISTQSHAGQVPALIAAMGLIYPDDMYYNPGGMSSYAYQLADIIKENGGDVLTRHRVDSIEPQGARHLVTGVAPAKKVFEKSADIVVSNLTVWDSPKLFHSTYRERFKVEKERGAWGALTAYFACRPEKAIDPLYHQVHYNHPRFGKGSFFFSFSHPKDLKRAPENWQTVTVSTHTRADSWPKKEDPAYKTLKEEYGQWIEDVFEKHFVSHKIIEKTDIEVGSPLTFNRFTRRHKGLVGGLPHNLKNNILTFPSQETPVENFYQIGDTTFPGQGVVGVVTGALMLAGKLTNTNFLKNY
jgi:C-3',4' desaturase CrtD